MFRKIANPTHDASPIVVSYVVFCKCTQLLQVNLLKQTVNFFFV